jgi:predicted cytidylate kinase
MIISLSGKPGTGKSTVAKIISKKLGLKHFSIGDLQREFAKENNITIEELGILESKDDQIDRKVDSFQAELPKKYKNFIIDSRLGFYFIKDSIKIFLDCNLEEGARRIYSDTKNNKRDSSEKKAESIEETKKIMIERERTNQKRFKKYYKIDFLDKSNYDLFIDTTKLKPDQVVKKIIGFVNTKLYKHTKKPEKYGKNKKP